MSDRWTERLSEYLDGELSATDQTALAVHLETCDDCSAVLSELRRVVDQARMAEDYVPQRDLWPGIARRIGAAPAASARIGRRWSFSLPQLAAAAILLMTLSGSAVWLLRSTGPLPRGPVATMITPAVTPAINASTSASASYAAAVADLERVLASGRGQLDTTTVRVIEQNLAAIDQAIAQAQRALQADPANLYLNTHLAETMRRKLDLLRQAATLVPVS
jgi:anti-sigma factor RsiW